MKLSTRTYRDGGLRTEEERNVKKCRRFDFLYYFSLFHSIKCRVVQSSELSLGSELEEKTIDSQRRLKCTLGS
ncbi:hypothetical protein Q3G72_003913 [Acer saccharum]|nr:hypothetical protein Q3G72_003913 [Acer saccharum]